MISIKEKASERVSTVMPLRKVAQEGYFFDKRGKIVDIMQVVSKDLENMSEIEKEIEFLKPVSYTHLTLPTIRLV